MPTAERTKLTLGKTPCPDARQGQLCEYNGHLAVLFSRSTAMTQPRVEEMYFDSGMPVESDTRSFAILIGKNFAGGINDRREVLISGYTYMTVDTTDWEIVEVNIPLPAPRDGQQYTWEWSTLFGQWRKKEFPWCSECQKCHSYDIPYCSNCGRHHKPGKGPKYSDGSRCE